MKKVLAITCPGFTITVLTFVLLSRFRMTPELTNSIAIELFIMSLSISLLMVAGEKIEYKLDVSSIFVDVLMRVLICYIVVFIEGSLFGMFPFSWISFMYITPVMIPAFIFTYTSAYLTCIEYANEINKNIRSKNKK